MQTGKGSSYPTQHTLNLMHYRLHSTCEVAYLLYVTFGKGTPSSPDAPTIKEQLHQQYLRTVQLSVDHQAHSAKGNTSLYGCSEMHVAP